MRRGTVTDLLQSRRTDPGKTLSVDLIEKSEFPEYPVPRGIVP